MSASKSSKVSDYEAKFKYTADTARHYLAQRAGDRKWQREQEIFRALLAAVPRGSSILDVPVGTGRFIPFYKEFGCDVQGVDISEDMLDEARKEASAHQFHVRFFQGDAERLPQRNAEFDYVVCARLLNWVPLPTFEIILREFTRVSRVGIFVEIREATPLSGKDFAITFVSRLVRRPRTIAGPLVRRLLFGKPMEYFLHDSDALLKLFARHYLEVVQAIVVDETVKLSARARTRLVIYNLRINRDIGESA